MAALASESFVICVQRCEVQVLESGLLDAPYASRSRGNLITIQPGQLAKVRDNSSPSPHQKHVVVIVRIYDFYERNLAFENNLFTCPAANLQVVAPPLWPFLIGINEPGPRIKFFRNSESVAYLLGLAVNDLVIVNGALIDGSSNHSNPFLTCIIRYIGLVSEIGPGFYFGLEITDLDIDPPSQLDYCDFIADYVSTNPNAGLIVRANAIELPASEERKKSSTEKSKEYFSKILSSTVEKAKNEFTNRASTLRRSSKRTANKQEDQEANRRYSWNTNQGYNLLIPDQPDNQPIITQQPVKMDRSIGNLGGAVTMSNLRRDDDASDRSTSTKSSQLTNGSSSNNSETMRSARSSTSGGNSTGTTKKKTPPLKPTTILSLEDRDLVIIDGNDIKESVQNESEVIVVDNPRSVHSQAAAAAAAAASSTVGGEVDLMDILGNNWPASAGDTAHVLNTASTMERRANGQAIKPNLGELTQRNKSMNIISHLKTTKSQTLPRNATPGVNYAHSGGGTGSGSTNSSFESSHSGSTSTKKKSLDGPIYDNLANASAEAMNSSQSSPLEDFNPIPLTEVPNSKLGLGSMVEVQLKDTQSLYGVIQWIGLTQPGNLNSCLVGVELDDEPLEDVRLPVSDGSYSGVRIFKCPPNRAIFVPPTRITKDRRFQDQPSTSSKGASAKQVDNYKMFGQKDCPVVPGFVPPLKILAPSDLEKVCGKFKGIQGHHNSCYLDATLFSMFTFTSVFDSLLFRPPDNKDIAEYDEVQTVLRDEIVNPLRKNLFVRADRVLKLRKLMDRLSSVSGLMTEEKDPEEFLNSLLAQILRVQPFLQLSSGQDAYFYQLFVEKDERLSFPSVQQLFEQSFLQSNIKLKEVPSCLIIQMPRFGKDYKLYPRILPSLVLDVTHIIEDSPRPCSVCNNLALFECKDCFGTMDDDFESTAFCGTCLDRTHSPASGRQSHTTRSLQVPEDFRRMNANNCITVPHLFMELFAVVCIETSHYVSFVKAGSGQDAPWCFFDSMADRKGEVNGYNIPEMLSVSELAQWLSEDGARDLNESFASDKMLPEHARRLFCDAYMCMYQSSDIMMYR